MPTNKSRPVYGTLAPDRTGRFHVIVGEGPGSAAIVRLLSDPEFPHGPCRILYSDDPSMDSSDRAAIVTKAGIDAEILPDSATLLARLPLLLAGCLMGTRLYAVGSESFLGAAMRIAAAAGLRSDECQTQYAGSAARQVHCTHCRHVNIGVTTNVVPCAGCGRTLLVRDHYSQRLAAFMGVQVDAEIPGELPRVQDAFR